MFEFDVTKFVPNFLLADKNGHALAMAIGKGLEYLNTHVQDGVDALIDTDTMPEWRLDELAWEYDCIYDNDADIETKRRWISEIYTISGKLGTPFFLKQYIAHILDEFTLVDQSPELPYNFFVFSDDVESMTQDEIDFIINAINKAKNVRSHFNGFQQHTQFKSLGFPPDVTYTTQEYAFIEDTYENMDFFVGYNAHPRVTISAKNSGTYEFVWKEYAEDQYPSGTYTEIPGTTYGTTISQINVIKDTISTWVYDLDIYLCNSGGTRIQKIREGYFTRLYFSRR